VFNGEFVIDDKRDKNINTRNYELFRINLCKWYKRHIIEPTLAALENLQTTFFREKLFSQIIYVARKDVMAS